VRLARTMKSNLLCSSTHVKTAGKLSTQFVCRHQGNTRIARYCTGTAASWTSHKCARLVLGLITKAHSQRILVNLGVPDLTQELWCTLSHAPYTNVESGTPRASHSTMLTSCKSKDSPSNLSYVVRLVVLL
jgi:hypothetical protein